MMVKKRKVIKMNNFLSALEKHKNYFLSMPGVVSIGIGLKTVRGINTGQLSLVIGVEKKRSRLTLSRVNMVPRFLDSLPTDVMEVGKIRFHGFALPPWAAEKPTANQDDIDLRKSKVRPAIPGVSIGHYKTSAGTLGAVVKGPFPGGMAILSNNHILANGTDGKDGLAAAGDPILQPGPYDGGTEKDVVARLVKFVPYKWVSTDDYKKGKRPPANYVDAALAVPTEPNIIKKNILGVGPVRGYTEAFPGMPVIKSGRSTGVTSGRITAIHNTISIDEEDRAFIFEDQIATTPMSDSGDSGSLILTPEQKAVGLLFAGSDRVTYAAPIERVLRSLNVSL
jgi:hypothetical protein